MKRFIICLTVGVLACASVVWAAAVRLYPNNSQFNRVTAAVVTGTSDWTTIVATPTSTDNSAATVVNPVTIITNDTTREGITGGGGTTAQVRLRYKTAATVTASPLIQVFGLDNNNAPERLFDRTGVHELTLLVNATTDARDATYSYTDPIEVDVNNNSSIVVGIKTALAASDTTGAVIQARLK